MTTKLYYQDPYIKSFQAEVLKQTQDETGEWYVVLNETAFYPTGGGQPHDQGTIAMEKVTKVEEVNGEIRHYLKRPLDLSSSIFKCKIDWERRFDHMQQHTGQHILSAAFEQLFNYNTVGFHLGSDIVTIDLEREQLSKEEAARAEGLANQIILDNRFIEPIWVTEEELSNYPLRKETKVKENIRLVIIPDFDYNGCGGTHPKSTGEVRAIKILGWEKQRKNIRLQFVCGDRVLKQLGQKQEVLLELTKMLNAPEKDMVSAVVRLLETGKKLDKSLEEARETMLQYEAKEISALNTQSIVSKVFQQRTIQELQKLARFMIAEDPHSLVFLVAENDQERLQLVCARGEERSESMKALMGKILPLINGKGGGNEAFAQGGGAAVISGQDLLAKLLEMYKV